MRESTLAPFSRLFKEDAICCSLSSVGSPRFLLVVAVLLPPGFISGLGATRQAGHPIYRAPPHLWLFDGGSNGKVGGMYAGQRKLGFTNGRQCMRRRLSDTCRRGVSSSGMARGTGVIRSHRRGGVLRAGTLAARSDRWDVKHDKTKKSKTSKSKSPSSSLPSSSSLSAAGVGGGGGGASRGGPKLLRLSKLLADRAVGSRSEVRLNLHPTVPTTLVRVIFDRPNSASGNVDQKCQTKGGGLSSMLADDQVVGGGTPLSCQCHTAVTSEW